MLDGLTQAVPAHEFLFGRFTGLLAVSVHGSCRWLGINLFFHSGLTPKSTANAAVVVAPPTEASPDALATAQATLDAQLLTLYMSLPPRTAVAIFTNHSDPRLSQRSRVGRKRMRWIDPSGGLRVTGGRRRRSKRQSMGCCFRGSSRTV